MEKRSIGLLILLAALAFVLTSVVPVSADSVIYAIADTFASEVSGQKDTPMNGQGITIKNQNTMQRYGYITFTFGSKTVAQAYLLLFQTWNWSGADALLRYRCGEYTVDEEALTWNTKPDVSTWTPLADMWTAIMDARKYYAADITSVYNANLGKTMTFFLRGPGKISGDVGTTYEDREGSRWLLDPPAYTAPSPAYPYIQTLDAVDTSAPSVPTDLQAAGVAWDKIELNWTASTDNVAIARYIVYRDGVAVTTEEGNKIWGTSFIDSGLVADQTYTYTVSAIDYAGNESAQSTAAVATARPPDTSPPSVPTDLVLRTACTSTGMDWTASTDDVAVTGYRIKRNGVEVGTSATTTFTETSVEIGETYTYEVSAYDFAGNESAAASATGTIPTCYDGTEIKFEFDDGGSSVYTYTSDPRTFFTSAFGTAATNHWFGRRVMGRDGSISWQNYYDQNNYRYEFSAADGGSLTIQTATPVGEGGENNAATFVKTNDFGDWWKWSLGENYRRGVKIEADIDIVGDLNGWCAPWGDYPGIGECEWTIDNWHQGSDWGSQHGLRAGLYVSLASGRDLPDALAPEGSVTSTGNGVAYWFAVRPGSVHDPNDDTISIYSPAQYDHASFRFKDGLGFGLIPEDGISGPARDGIITGTGNKMKLTVAVCNAGGDSEYWDIWVTRPSGDTTHINPVTCDWVMSSQNSGNYARFGLDGHTFGSTYHLGGDSSVNSIAIGQNTMNQIFGTKHNSITLRNDWDGVVTIPVDTLGDVHKLGVGTRITLDATGGEKIVTLDSTTADYETYFYYIEQEDRSAGVKVIVSDFTDPFVTKGQQVTALEGVISRDNNGNLVIDVTSGSVSFAPATKTIEPVGMNNLTVGGSAVSGGVGTVNTGILTTVWGEVVGTAGDAFATYFELNDGSGTIVKVCDLFYDGFIVSPVEGEYWMATGPIALESDGVGGFTRMLIADSARKLK